jgi:hypothetical protein
MFVRKVILLTFLVNTMVSGAYAQNRFEIEPSSARISADRSPSIRRT